MMYLLFIQFFKYLRFFHLVCFPFTILLFTLLSQSPHKNNMASKKHNHQKEGHDIQQSSQSHVCSQSFLNNSDSGYDINQEEYYEVEKILEKRIRKGVTEYFVKWKDWDLPEHNTWQNMNNLKNVKHLVKQFEQEQKKKKADNSKPIRKQQKVKTQQNKKIEPSSRVPQAKSKEDTPYNKQQLRNQKKQSKQVMEKQSMEEKQRYKTKQSMRNQLNVNNQICLESDSDDGYEKMNISTQLSNPNKSLPKRTINSSLPHLQHKASIKSIQSRNSINNIDGTMTTEKPITKIGCISNHIVEENKLFYQCNIMNRFGNIIGVRKFEAQEIKRSNPQQVRQYLEQMLLDINIFYEMCDQSEAVNKK